MLRALLPSIKRALMLFILCGCSRPNEVKVVESNSASYIAVAGPDTAWLDLTIKGATFKGRCAINYNNRFVDSGEVRGLIRGDSLLGDFHYLHYGLEWKRVAFALLRKRIYWLWAKVVKGSISIYPTSSRMNSGSTACDLSSRKSKWIKLQGLAS
jgi:hypothetical protein